jgi:hypothetical protein
MKSEIWLALAAAGACIAVSISVVAQDTSGTMPPGAKADHEIPAGTVVTPESSIPKGPGRAHTHLEYVVPKSR